MAGGILQIANAIALGSAVGGTTVLPGATLEFSGGIDYSTPEVISIAGAGVGAGGHSAISTVRQLLRRVDSVAG